MDLAEGILIEKFLRNKLSKIDKEFFLQKIASDIKFKENFEFEKQLFESLNEEEWSFTKRDDNSTEIKEYLIEFRSNEIVDLKNTLQNENNIYQKSVSKKSLKSVFYITAAVLLLLISVISFIDFKKEPLELYASYLSETELTSIITRSTHQEELKNAQILFESKEYEKALSIFEKEIHENQIGSIFIYTGISQLELNQFNKAENTFNKLILSDLLDAPKGKWFLALLHLKKNEINKVKPILKEIISNKYFNHEKANELLNEIK